MKAVLMNKKTPILDIEIEDGLIKKTGRVLNEGLMPIHLVPELKLEDLQKWFMGRRIPQKREGLPEARKGFAGFEKDKNYFSLSDQYWVRYTQSETWDKLNFFTNRYSTEVGKIFFEPWAVDKENMMAPSPDRTTNGVLIKRWVQDASGKSFLHKAGSEVYHQEPLSEVMASMMLEKLKLVPFVPYELIVDGLRFCSRCQNFVTADTEFVPAAALYKKKPRPESVSHYDHLLNVCEQHGVSGAKDFIDNMIIADHIMWNSDRHLGNFGFLRSATSGEILGFAPLFDCGSAYWGTTNAVKARSSVLFPEQEEQILKAAIKNGKITDVKVTPAMRELLKMYPDITDEKKEQILNTIDQAEKDMQKNMERTLGKAAAQAKKESKYDMEIEMR